MTTIDLSLRSFVDVPSDSHFPIQNLPFGVFRPSAGLSPRIGVAIGDAVLDLSVLGHFAYDDCNFFGPDIDAYNVSVFGHGFISSPELDCFR